MAYIQSEAQREATKKWQYIGTRIRQLCCLDSIASRHLDHEQQKVIRNMVDSELNKLGYESLTSRNSRYRNAITNCKWDDIDYKFQKLET